MKLILKISIKYIVLKSIYGTTGKMYMREILNLYLYKRREQKGEEDKEEGEEGRSITLLQAFAIPKLPPVSWQSYPKAVPENPAGGTHTFF